jgi:hypothetical protein
VAGCSAGICRFCFVSRLDHRIGVHTTGPFDKLSALVRWLEHGKALDSVIASARGAGNAAGANAGVPTAWVADRTRPRPLCAYPEVARYNGAGDVEKAGSFSCK